MTYPTENLHLALYITPAVTLLIASMARNGWAILLMFIGIAAGLFYNLPRIGLIFDVPSLYQYHDETFPMEDTATLFGCLQMSEIDNAGWIEPKHAWVSVITTLTNVTFLIFLWSWRRKERKAKPAS